MEKYPENQTAKGLEVGIIVADWFDESIRIIIMRGPVSFCVYLGIPLDHPLAGKSYNDLLIECHGGLTFSAKGEKQWPEGYWWYGYDYAHGGDKVHFKTDYGLDKLSQYEHDWTLEEIEKDSWEAIYSFQKLIKLSEDIWKSKTK